MFSPYAMPVFMLNLGGEVIYVLKQRLVAHGITDDKARRVLADIAAQLLDEDLMKTLTQPGPMYSHASLRRILDRIIRQTAMRLNDTGVDKLLDLACMTVKFQLMNCTHPAEIIAITANHLDNIVRICCARSDDDQAGALRLSVDTIRRDILTGIYGTMRPAELRQVWTTMLVFLQDMSVKVSVFMAARLQNPSDGTFNIRYKHHLAPQAATPGGIRFYAADGDTVVRTERFIPPVEISALRPRPDASVTHLGHDLFNNPITPPVAFRAPVAKSPERVTDVAKLKAAMKIDDVASSSQFKPRMFDIDMGQDDDDADGSKLAVHPLELVPVATETTPGTIDNAPQRQSTTTARLSHVQNVLDTLQISQPAVQHDEDDLLALMDE